MKAQLVKVNDKGDKYDALKFVCPGCESAGGGSGLHLLPVNNNQHEPSWEWDGNLEEPTLSPSILTTTGDVRCHSFLKQGLFQFLADCSHELAGEYVPIPDLPEWAVDPEPTEESPGGSEPE